MAISPSVLATEMHRMATVIGLPIAGVAFSETDEPRPSSTYHDTPDASGYVRIDWNIEPTVILIETVDNMVDYYAGQENLTLAEIEAQLSAMDDVLFKSLLVKWFALTCFNNQVLASQIGVPVKGR